MNRARLVGPARLVATVAAAGGLVALATTSPASPSAPNEPTAAGSRLAPVTSAALSCPGPELSGIDGVDDIDVPARIAAATAPEEIVTGDSVLGRGELVIRSGTETGETVTQRGIATSEDARSGVASEIVATGPMAPGLVAAQEWSVARDEIRGLATVPCAGPGSDHWLLAGGGDAGRQERLILTNPGANEVTVDLTALGAKGPLRSPSGLTVVPARGRVAVLVDAITGAEESPAVRVRASGGTVRAVMSDMWLDGSVPAGAETTVPTAEPSTRQIIPGAFVGTSGSIRIAVPDRQQAVVSARVIGPGGPSPLQGGVIRVAGRSTGELPIKGLARGTYAVELTSDVPIVASAWSTDRSGSAPGDFAWSPSTAPAKGLLGAAYPETEEERIRLVSLVATGGPAKANVLWREDADDAWSVREVSLNKDTSTTVEIGAATTVWVLPTSGPGEIRSAVSSVGGVPGSRLVSVAPLAASSVLSSVSRAHPVP
ncbi:hypothetical protein N802_18575 [Knoellia sinensis KCTC 19936]|uniref:Large extracellular alpha-helical protein n=1 Tax=Knoellia sinensis KCTC 19936 TaxID=1385520 RepID=A0A0A0J9T6_9MICO|nr:DUF5719 family protein [Knoellia sinensis]KGN32371.1 hypothetical protein N802_18575 [Knoellia sinensis KCTC 19936]